MLSDAELHTLRAVAEALIPPGGRFPLGAGDVGTAERVERYLAGMAPETQRQVRLLLRAWEAAPLASRHFRRFSRLAPAARDEWVERCLASRLPWRRVPLLLLKTLCLSAFCADPRVEQALGYGHGCLDARAPGSGPRLTPLQYPEVRGDVEEVADACVVGSGAGGAVAAYELACAGLRVVVLEEGAYFTQADFTGPPMERVQRFYRNGGATVALGRPTIPVPLGKCVGGTTVVNSGTCFRTPARVLGAWASEH
ncbi:MAG: FAD-binding protein, partial [Deltaproteobacteria bacterium]